MSDFPKNIQSHFDDPYHRGSCEHGTHLAEDICRETGCQLRFELAVDEQNQVVEAWFDAEGCEFCEATASMLCEAVEGLCGDEIMGRRPVSLLDGTGFFETVRVLADPTQMSDAPLARSQVTSSDPRVLAPPCVQFACQLLQHAFLRPISQLEDDLADGSQFGGPSLSEEC